jgi:hypothetical protein
VETPPGGIRRPIDAGIITELGRFDLDALRWNTDLGGCTHAFHIPPEQVAAAHHPTAKHNHIRVEQHDDIEYSSGEAFRGGPDDGSSDGISLASGFGDKLCLHPRRVAAGHL